MNDKEYLDKVLDALKLLKQDYSMSMGFGDDLQELIEETEGRING
jgi:hypothetical protein